MAGGGSAAMAAGVRRGGPEGAVVSATSLQSMAWSEKGPCQAALALYRHEMVSEMTKWSKAPAASFRRVARRVAAGPIHGLWPPTA